RPTSSRIWSARHKTLGFQPVEGAATRYGDNPSHSRTAVSYNDLVPVPHSLEVVTQIVSKLPNPDFHESECTRQLVPCVHIELAELVRVNALGLERCQKHSQFDRVAGAFATLGTPLYRREGAASVT